MTRDRPVATVNAQENQKLASTNRSDNEFERYTTLYDITLIHGIPILGLSNLPKLRDTLFSLFHFVWKLTAHAKTSLDNVDNTTRGLVGVCDWLSYRNLAATGSSITLLFGHGGFV